MSKIIITGADGFLGSHCVDAALERGLSVTAVCAYRPDGRVGYMETYRDRVEIVRADIGDLSYLKGREETPIINCAALVSVPYSYDMPNEYWRVNAEAVMKMAQLCPNLVQVSTSEVFDGLNPPYSVDSPRNPITPYGAAKAAAEMAVLGYSKTAKVVRIFNLFGPRQFPRAVHPLFIRAALALKRGEDVTLDGPHGSRAFLYAPWVAKELVWVCEDLLHNPPGIPSSMRLLQLASMNAVEISTLWHVICKEVAVDPDSVTWNAEAGKRGVANLFGRSSRPFATKDYDFVGLVQTIEWYRANPNYAADQPYQ